MRALIVVVAFALAGCQSISPSMSAEQLKAISADKNASVVCSKFVTAAGTGTVVVVNLDQSVIKTGTVTSSADCVVAITTEAPPPKHVAP
jgi:hypothetical protein